MRFVFLFAPGIPFGGVEVSSLRLARALSDAGHDVELLIHGTEAECHPALLPMAHGFRHFFCPSFVESSHNEIISLYEGKEDAVFFPNQLETAYRLLRVVKSNSPGTKILGICHSDHDDYYALAKREEDIVDVQFGVSERVCTRLDSQLSNPSRLLILGVPVPAQCPDRISSRKLKLLYTGRLENYGKRCSELVPAGHALSRAKIPYRLDIIGDGPYRKWILDDLKSVPFLKRRHIQLHDPVPPDALAAWYSRSDIYLSFTRFEGNSIAIMEAMAYGCIPVVPRVSGTESMIKHLETGWLGTVDNPASLIDGCLRLYREPLLRRQLSAEAHAYAKKHCDIRNTVLAVEHALADNARR